ncbi:MAG TPA: SUKH-4 family immunity protein [Verrucomicrobiales bacterium]|jgi:hypothetical protein|nr:SUKH-4 family immunity protein [Verrucomicrobiales bacterium]
MHSPSLPEDGQHYRWTEEELAGADIPDGAKSFLASTGLPRVMGSTTFEFGSFDSSGPLVIGADDGVRVYVNPTGEVWHESIDGKEGDQFMNSSVQQLAHFAGVWTSWYEGLAEASDEEVKAAALAAIERLKECDPAAFADEERWVWPLMWEDLLYMCG